MQQRKRLQQKLRQKEKQKATTPAPHRNKPKRLTPLPSHRYKTIKRTNSTLRKKRTNKSIYPLDVLRIFDIFASQFGENAEGQALARHTDSHKAKRAAAIMNP
jgi:hypothetical protein